MIQVSPLCEIEKLAAGTKPTPVSLLAFNSIYSLEQISICKDKELNYRGKAMLSNPCLNARQMLPDYTLGCTEGEIKKESVTNNQCDLNPKDHSESLTKYQCLKLTEYSRIAIKQVKRHTTAVMPAASTVLCSSGC